MNPIDQVVVDKMRSFLGDRTNEILEAYVTSSEQHVQKIKVALVEQNKEALRLSVHALKGSSGTIGAMRVMAIAREIEIAMKAGQATSPEKIDELLLEISRANEVLKQMLSA
jgi:HPt (histidine-containing phosphotransfer) domain-containing protein